MLAFAIGTSPFAIGPFVITLLFSDICELSFMVVSRAF